MGNGASEYSYEGYNGPPRIEVETPINSEPTRPRVTFANRPSGIETITVRPRMDAIGEFPLEFLTGRKVKYTRNQGIYSTEVTGNGRDARRAVQSGDRAEEERPGNLSRAQYQPSQRPMDGMWDPILDPYGQRPDSKDINRGVASGNQTPVATYTSMDNHNTEVYKIQETGRQIVTTTSAQVVRNGLDKADI